MKHWWAISLIGIVVGFLTLLWHYDDVILPCWSDEVFFIQPAQNLAEGKGMGTPVLDDLLPNISKRTYWQPPIYFLALSLWGKVFGFELLPARWFSRFCGALGLVLVFLLARSLGLPTSVSLLCSLWTALDLLYQYQANLARMDILNTVFATLLAFAFGIDKGKERAFKLAGVMAAAATLTHFVSLPIIAVLLFTLIFYRRWKSLLWFSFPITLCWLVWLLYALQDWESFIGQLEAQFFTKQLGASDPLPSACFSASLFITKFVGAIESSQ